VARKQYTGWVNSHQRRCLPKVREQSSWTAQMYSNVYGRVRGWGRQKGCPPPPYSASHATTVSSLTWFANSPQTQLSLSVPWLSIICLARGTHNLQNIKHR
jgi:hypothetical protein